MEVDRRALDDSPPRRSSRRKEESDSSGSDREHSRKKDSARRRGDESSEEEARSRKRERRRRHSSSESSSSGSDSEDSRRKKSKSDRERRKREKREEEEAKEKLLAKERAKVEALVAANAATGGRSGGVYIPPHRLALLRQEAAKKADGNAEANQEYQKMTWEALRKSINGLVNKVSPQNIKNIVVELFRENIWRGRGLLCRSLMKSQGVSPKFTPVYAALVAIINTKIPDIGLLLIKRLVDQFKKGYRRRDKQSLLSATRFIAQLVNQLVCGVVLPLQILLLLLEKPTDDSIEVAVAFMQEVGQRLSEVSPQAFNGIFDQFRTILHEGTIDKRVVYMIEGLFAVRRKEFVDYPAIHEDLDLVEEEDQVTHESVTLDDDEDEGPLDVEERLDFFKLDPDYKRHEEEYEDISREILGEDEDDDSSDDEDDPSLATSTVKIEDATANDITTLKRAIYLVIMSSRDHEEVVHKLLELNLAPDQLEHVCRMVILCCAQERTYLKFYGLISQRLCLLRREFQQLYEQQFEENYTTIHRYDNNMLRNVARLFAHILFTDAIPWTVFKCVHINERDTTASSRIFIKILFTDLVENLGLPRLIKRVQHPTLLHPWLEGMFPTTSPKDTKFAINYWTAVELGALTEPLRAAYNEMIRKISERRAADRERQIASSSSGSDSDSDSGSYSDSSSGSYSSSRSSRSSGSYSSSSSSSRPRRK